MSEELRTRFSEILNTVPLWGIDRDFLDLSTLNGPPVPDWLRGGTLYEVYVRAFSNEGTIRKLTERLPRIKKLAIDTIWLMPIFPIGEEDRKGTCGSPYAIQDFYRVNPEYGSAVDFIDLVRKAHALDMKVILDMVPNHVALDYEYLKKQPGLVMRDKEGMPVRKISDWSDVADLDYGNPVARKHISEIMQYWLREFEIDGYRVDVAGMVPISFWESVIPYLKAIKPDLFMLAEWESPGLHKEVFQSTYDWTLYSLMLQVNEGRIPVKTLRDWVNIKAHTYPKNAFPLRFIENHDKPRAVTLFKGKSIIPFLVFIFSIDGLPLIYNGQEIGTSAYPSLFEKEPIDWEDTNKGLHQLYKILIGLRKKYISLSAKNYTFVEHDRENDVLVYLKLGTEKIVALINFRDALNEVSMSSMMLSRIKNGRILFNSKRTWEIKNNKILLQPYQAALIEVR